MRDPEVLVSGPAGTGKSRACLEKVLFTCLLNPGARVLIVRKTASSLGNTALVTFREHVAAEALAAGDCVWYGGSAQESGQYRFTNGSVINIGGMDKATRVMSSEYDLVYVQEATELTEDDWEALTTRLRNGVVSYQQIIADCNPSTPTHWLKERCESGRTSILYANHQENPRLYGVDGTMTSSGESYMKALDNLSGVNYLRLRKGQWVAAEGMIYEDFDPSIHVVDSFDVPFEWPRYWSIDFGVTHPTVIQFWCVDPDGRLFLYREIYHTGRTGDQHGRQVLDLVTDEAGLWTEPRPTAVFADHDAAGRLLFTRTVGVSTRLADKRVNDGIQAVQLRLRPAADGRPRIFLMRGALVERDAAQVQAKKPTCTADEIPGYIWDGTGSAKTTKEQPLKIDDDGSDAMRYVVMGIDNKRTTRVSWM